MKKLIYKIKLLYYRSLYSESTFLEDINGKFRVHYRDGNISRKMYYKNAKNYADIFGGRVEIDLT